ncbi:MAG: hypothetical protein AVO33_07510 [delta proteobacterium ML8_F1]|nr:MAG: hypothetical protein AVO33_07510 [delta proteobacterium ML8_F1]
MDKQRIHQTLNRIMVLDEEAEAFKKQASEEIKTIKRDFSRKLKDLEAEYLEGVKKESLEASRDILDDADRWRDYILSESDSATAYLEAFYEEHLEELMDKVLKEIFTQEKE